MTDDARDLEAAASDPEALARLYDRHAPFVLSVCRRHSTGHSMAEAEDAMQETLVRAMSRLDRLESPGQLRAFLHSIARHVCSERRRSESRRQRREGAAAALTAAERGDGPTSEELVGDAEQVRRLDEALGRLTDDERAAVHLYYLDHDPVPTAMSLLGLSRSTFYQLLARARRRLAALLGEVPTS